MEFKASDTVHCFGFRARAPLNLEAIQGPWSLVATYSWGGNPHNIASYTHVFSLPQSEVGLQAQLLSVGA